MSNKNSRAGGKYTGSHTTLIPAAKILTDLAHKQPEVTKIALGIIKAGLPSVGGKRRVKITEKPAALFLSIRDNTTNQDIFIYTSDATKTKLALKRGAIEAGLEATFAKI